MHRNVENEIGIHWLEDKAKYPYLSESSARCSAKRGWRKARAGSRHVVAVAELADSVRTVQRRVYRRMWCFDDKLDPYPGRDCPSEAVNPDLICAGQESPHGRRAP